MMDIAEQRRASLKKLVERHTLSGLGRIVDKPARQINDMLTGRKSFGEKVARDIERRYDPDAAPGWLDSPEGSEGVQAPAEPGLVAVEQEQSPWPFRTVPYASFQQLTQSQKERLEQRVADFIDGALSDTRDTSTKTA